MNGRDRAPNVICSVLKRMIVIKRATFIRGEMGTGMELLRMEVFGRELFGASGV
jgi:hypothetical protein